MAKIVTVGYGGLESPHHLKRAIEEAFGSNYTLIDVRYKPVSKNPEWNYRHLVAVFGNRYRWLREWGNQGRFEGGGVAIADYEKGEAVVEAELAAGKVVVLMCQCPRVGSCHRRVVAAEFEARHPSVEVVHWRPTSVPQEQLDLWSVDAPADSYPSE